VITLDLEVSIRIRAFPSSGSSWYRRQNVSPSIPGIMMSRSTRSGGVSRAARSPSWPLCATSVAYPLYCSIVVSVSQIDGSSSTIRILPFVAFARGGVSTTGSRTVSLLLDLLDLELVLVLR